MAKKRTGKKSDKRTDSGKGRAKRDGAKPIKGRLKKDAFGYSLPIDQPLYHPPPVQYRDSTILTYAYETDPVAAANVLPAQLSLPKTPTAKMVFANYQWSSVGFYNEVVQALDCNYKGKPYVYPVRLHVTSDRAMASGREIGGFPKKMGDIVFNSGAEYFSCLESPAGMRVCSGVMIPTVRVPVPKEPSKYLSLRILPNYSGDAKNPSIRELLASVWELGPGELWAGSGSVHFEGQSELDPYHKLPIVKMLGSVIYRGDMAVSDIKLLERF